MTKFLFKVLLYALPVIIYVIYGEQLLYKYRENVSYKTVVQKQLNSDSELYFSRNVFSTPVARYKMEMIKIMKPEIITLGVSVVLQYRKFFFHPYEKSFYNGGFAINNVYDLASFVDLIRYKQIHRPKLIIFGFDASWIKQKYYNDNYDHVSFSYKDEAWNLNYHIDAIQQIVHRSFDHQPPFDKYTYNGYGVAGKMGIGYRKDGSYCSRDDIQAYLKNRYYKDKNDYKGKLQKNIFIYNNPMRVDEKKLALLLKSLKEIKELGIDLLIYVPPVANDFYATAKTNKTFRQIFPTYMQIQNQLIKQGYHVIPFSTPQQFGLTDDYMLDGIHAGEVFVSILFYNYMADNHMKFKNLPNLNMSYLKGIINGKRLCPLAFGEE